jgi:hypothetical protein
VLCVIKCPENEKGAIPFCVIHRQVLLAAPYKKSNRSLEQHLKLREFQLLTSSHRKEYHYGICVYQRDGFQILLESSGDHLIKNLHLSCVKKVFNSAYYVKSGKFYSYNIPILLHTLSFVYTAALPFSFRRQ